VPLQQVSFDYNGFRALTAEGGTKGVMSSLGFHPVIVERPRNKLEVRPPHQPSEALRRQVRALAAYGIPQDEIARVVGLSKPTLEKHYRPELDRAETETNSKVDEQACSLGLIHKSH
jgi:hypothetical protein